MSKPGTISELEAHIKQMIVAAFPEETDISRLDENTELFNLLDSLGTLRVIIEVERTFNIKIPNADSTPEKMGSVRRIARFIAQKPELGIAVPA